MDTVRCIELPFGGFNERQTAAETLSRLLHRPVAAMRHSLIQLAADITPHALPPRHILAELTPDGVQVWPDEPSNAPACLLRKGG